MNIQLSPEIYGTGQSHAPTDEVRQRASNEWRKSARRKLPASLRESICACEIFTRRIVLSNDDYATRIACTASATWLGSVTGNEQRSAIQTKAALPEAAFNFSCAGCVAGKSVLERARSTTRST